MCVRVSLFSLAWVLSGVTVFFNLALPFLDSHGVMGSHVWIELYCWMDSKLIGVDLQMI